VEGHKGDGGTKGTVLFDVNPKSWTFY